MATIGVLLSGCGVLDGSEIHEATLTLLYLHKAGAKVVCLAPDGREVARGLANYSAADARKIAGQGSDAIESLLGYLDEPELVHRDNLIVV